MSADKELYLPLLVPGKEKRERQTAAMHAMAALFILIYGLQYITYYQTDWMYLVALLPLSFFTLFTAFFRKRKFTDVHFNRSFRILESGFILMGAFHFLQEKNYGGAILYIALTLLLLFLFYIEMRTLQPQYAIFHDSQLSIETPLRTLRIPYTQLKQIVLHHNYLTLVYTDERFGQYEVVKDQYADIQHFLQQRFASH
jgi:hypothetical protein